MKKFNYTSLLVGASALALIALVLFQVQWMSHSTRLLEEQFNHRVNMALCNAVEKMATSEKCISLNDNCSAASPAGSCQLILDSIFNTHEGDAALNEALAFYKLDLPYEISVVESKEKASTNYSCSLSPLIKNDSHYLNIDFTEREAFVLNEMGFMTLSSLAIILFVGLVFLLSSYYLIRQKRMSHTNKDFFNHMTHEFRTPLTNIKLASKLLVKNTSPGHGREYVDIIQQESGQLMEQVERVLHLARLEQGDYQLKKEAIHINDLIQRVLAEMNLRITAENASINLQIPSTLPLLKGDAFHLANAFRNLIDNALKYCSGSPIIHITAKNHGYGILIQVQDNGQGISAVQQRYIFEKFKQGKISKSPGQKGFGLGLAYVKKIIDLHRGKIDISSTVGRGTRFDLFFPSAQKMEYAKTS